MAIEITHQYRSLAGLMFSVTPALVSDIENLITKVRVEIAAHRDTGCYIGYLSVPVSSKSGGNKNTNIKMAAHICERVKRQFGKNLWLLNPAAYELPEGAKGGDYMAVWADVLSGADGLGNDFDLAYFVGPSDIWEYFGAGAEDRLCTIEKWLADKAASDPEYKAIYDDLDSRRKFVRYYGLRGSTVYSKGAHDEWNIIVRLNAKRAVGEDIAVYFDGHPVEPGDYEDSIEAGNQTLLH